MLYVLLMYGNSTFYLLNKTQHLLVSFCHIYLLNYIAASTIHGVQWSYICYIQFFTVCHISHANQRVKCRVLQTSSASLVHILPVPVPSIHGHSYIPQL